MLLHSIASLSAILTLLALATLVDHAHARPHSLAPNADAALRKRQESPPPDPDSGPSPGNNTGGGQASTPLPPGLAAFQDATNLTAWQVLESHPSFTNLSSIALAHSPAVVAALNSTDPGTNLTVFAPYDPAFESLIKQPLFVFANSTDSYDALITQALAYHASNATDDRGAVYSNDIPPAPGNLTLTTLAGNAANVTLKLASERPPAPVSISQQPPPADDPPGVTVTVPTIQVPTPTLPTIQVPTLTVVRPTETSPPAGEGEAVGGPLPTEGPGAFANDARIIYANVTLANGVLHVVDRLISPLFILSPDLGQLIPTTLPVVTQVPPTPAPTT